MEKNQPKVVKAWCMYDWANSVYSLTITTAIFPIYWSNVVKGDNGSEYLNFFGISMKSEDVYSFTLSGAFVLIALINPLLSGVADYSGKKKVFMKTFAWLGSAACFSLFWFNDQNLWLGISAFMLATMGYAGSLVFYNAYLPEIVTEDQMDRVSARGFSMGYIGSLILLVFNLVTIMKWEWFTWMGIESAGDGTRFSFLTVGIWWFVFANYSFSRFPKEGKFTFQNEMFSKGYKEVKKVWEQLKSLPRLKTYLLAFFFYSMSFQTIMYLASIFGKKELKMDDGALISILLVIQLVAIAGAFLFSLGSKKIGNIHTLIVAVCLCIIVCIAAYFTTTAGQFFALAFLVGLIMGGIQSLSRSTYAKLLPESDDHASYFSFYELTDKVGTAVGTGMFGILNVITGSMRNSIVVLIVFFSLGIWQLTLIRREK
jgi:UMF1 family MFS transporter